MLEIHSVQLLFHLSANMTQKRWSLSLGRNVLSTGFGGSMKYMHEAVTFRMAWKSSTNANDIKVIIA